MSLLSKLLGEGKKEVLGALKEAAQKAGVDSLLNEVQNAAQNAQKQPGAQAAPQNAYRPQPRREETAESGFSWGEDMPEEENQYSFNGTYLAYFDMVFSQEFPQYRITRESTAKGRATVYSFWQGERKVLTAELMSERSEANKLRSACRAQGMPYVRFYYDHDGWWNTRSYVATRTRAALGL
jgi:hypothetical protein